MIAIKKEGTHIEYRHYVKERDKENQINQSYIIKNIS